MHIKWTLEAKKDLKKIYKFYTKHFSVTLAQKIKGEVLNKVKTLEHGTELGQEEELLKELNQGYRYLISNHNKIIYKVENKTAYITHVFDTRQDPEKLGSKT
ncbi:type II toxin-antitoxin system RelE/ParE family toxin [Crocinitomix catalasitica]|uniref:type II toxin-antitoxin system RelE/ParE family toxin n=1 Tax=Crocinitomix catalasitica TaxID=184607 RepID=UPI000486905E|nr:type II toxin-antitoxin system RelE/ParE family toxin [Crocinitomix catalasitica]